MLIELTHGKFAQIDDADFDLISRFKWYHDKGYARTTKRVGRISMHRLILGDPKGMHVDHINGDGLDNRRENLRLASRAENMRNCKIYSSNKSGYRGVIWKSQNRKWAAQIRVNSVLKHLGLFSTPEAASKAYDAASEIYHKEFGRRNQPVQHKEFDTQPLSETPKQRSINKFIKP